MGTPLRRYEKIFFFSSLIGLVTFASYSCQKSPTASNTNTNCDGARVTNRAAGTALAAWFPTSDAHAGY